MKIFSTESKPRLRLLVLILVLSGVLLLAGFVWNTQYNPFNQSVSFTTGKSRRILSFMTLFIHTVLQADKPVALQDQTQLEDQLRALNDKELSDAWNKLVVADNQQDLQAQTSNFLLLLTKKAQGNLNN